MAFCGRLSSSAAVHRSRKGGDPNARDAKRKDTPLHLAMLAGHEEAARVGQPGLRARSLKQDLLNAGADPDAQNSRHVTTFYTSLAEGTVKVRCRLCA